MNKNKKRVGMNSRVLIVDDDPGILEVCGETIEKLGVDVCTEQYPERALEKLKREYFDIVITDIRMPGIDGIKFAEKVKELSPSSLVIVMTAYPSLETAIKALRLSAYDYIIKPFTPEQLRASLRRALEHVKLRNENMVLRSQVERKYEFRDVVFRSEKMKKILELAGKVAQTDCEVLITGESGVGKELIARQIHKLSNRKNKRFVAVNLSAIPDNLVEAELFGYEKGAFTGASGMRVGLIEYADGGTLFLDEICEVSQDVQVKLLRFIQEKTVRRLGSNREIKVDVRIITATNKNIEEEVKRGSFREDLFYRINVFRIHIPPLRERKEDIKELIFYYMKKYSEEMGLQIRGIEEDALRALLNYPWFGNVRELQNVVKRAIVLAAGRTISADDLPDRIISHVEVKSMEDEKSTEEQYEVGRSDVGGDDGVGQESNFFALRKKHLEEFERKYLVCLLERFGGNVQMAQKHSGIPRATFYRMLKKYGIEPSEFR